MHQEKFQKIFGQISKGLTLNLLSENKNPVEKIIRECSDDLVWDTIDDLKNFDCIELENSKTIFCRHFFKRPVRILFFVMLSEFENRLFRIHERRGKLISELNEKNLNDLIRELAESDLVNLQNEYETRSKFKEEMKSVSSFRNIIMHVNKKLEKEIDADILIKRKSQILKLLSALQQISDNMECVDCESLKN